MKTQTKINDVYAVAVWARSQRLREPVQCIEEYRVRLSADVTAHCRRKKLLTDSEFVSFGVWYFDRQGWALTPNVYDDEGRKHIPGVPALAGAREYEPVQPCEELQEEFMASKPLLHPLRRHVPTTFKNQSCMLIGTGIDPNQKAKPVAPPPRVQFYSIGARR